MKQLISNPSLEKIHFVLNRIGCKGLEIFYRYCLSDKAKFQLIGNPVAKCKVDKENFKRALSDEHFSELVKNPGAYTRPKTS